MTSAMLVDSSPRFVGQTSTSFPYQSVSISSKQGENMGSVAASEKKESDLVIAG